MFKLIAQGCGADAAQKLTAQGAKDTFALAPLDSRLFDESATPLLNKVVFPNSVWQTVIRLMSLSGGKGRGKRQGRVSYQLLSINQLGAVYEALLSYRGFFASETLYEVQPAPKKGKAAANDDDLDENDESSDDGDSSSASASNTDLLDSAWFVPESRIGDYTDAERVYDKDDNGHLKLRKYEKGSFIYRLDPDKTNFITRSATFTSYKSVLEDVHGLNHKLLAEYGLENRVIESNNKKQDFHAKFYAAVIDDSVEVMSGSANLVSGPSIENITFKRYKKDDFIKKYLEPLSHDFIIRLSKLFKRMRRK